jgi:hypothetical protein
MASSSMPCIADDCGAAAVLISAAVAASGTAPLRAATASLASG